MWFDSSRSDSIAALGMMAERKQQFGDLRGGKGPKPIANAVGSEDNLFRNPMNFLLLD